MDTEKASETASESDFFLNDGTAKDKSMTVRVWPWKLSTVFFAVLSLVVFLESVSVRNFRSSFNETLSVDYQASDFPAAREAIETIQVKFTGNAAYHDDGTMYVPNPDPVKYVGEPSWEIDMAWHNLSGDRDFLITEAEAKELWPNDYPVHWHHEKGGYLVGLDMFHTLHCVNNIRRLFYPEYYVVPESANEAKMIHFGHCIEQIRQYVMCAGDMTAYGTRYYASVDRNYADSDVTHTCRNFEKLREWTSKRYHAGGELHIPGVEIWD
ncbi:MAG: hypothetical protein MMC33_005231 [Icmadophila ericetorum]|nr:hypothetical protein [Icmadophila ericetorum]